MSKLKNFIKKHKIAAEFKYRPCLKEYKYLPTGWDDAMIWDYKLTINNKEVLQSEFRKGLGHNPFYKGARVLYGWNTFINSLRTGKGIPLPTIEELLPCLASDSDALNYKDFESWACNYGYDPDSREAERTYHACMAIALPLHAFLGHKEFQKLQEISWDC